MIFAQEPFLDVGPVWPKVIASAVVFGVFVAIWLLLRKVGDALIDRVVPADVVDAEQIDRRQRIITLWTAARRVLIIVFIALAAVTLMALWGIPIAPLLTLGGVIGVAIGFGAQSFVKDVIAGFFIVAENQYAIGDVVRVADIAGKVEDIRLRTTVLRDLDGNVHYVPNGSIAVASNYTQDFATVVADIGVAYGEDVDRVITVLGDEARLFEADPEWSLHFLGESQVLGVQTLGDWSVVVRVLLTVVPDSRWMVKREFNRRVKVRLDSEGIEIPFPHRTIVTKEPAPASGHDDPE